jgi:opacity protein-like surface antigen
MKSLLTVAVITLTAPAVAQDWSGFYGVVGLGGVSGAGDQFDSGALTDQYDAEGTQVSLGVGYNVQNGALVYGGEFSYSMGKITFPGFDDRNFIDGIIDLKGRVGYATGKLLIYGTLGYTMADQDFLDAPAADADGFSYGIGVDMMVSDRLFAGLEYLRRNLDVEEGDIVGFPDFSYENELDTISLRVGMRF